MATFERCPKDVNRMAASLIADFENNKPLENLNIDYLFAFGEVDDVTGKILTPALVKDGYKVEGICRKTSLKERALGHGDIEITLDGDYWKEANEAQRRALLDHEFYHVVVTDKTDDCERPIIKLRQYDVQVGWFKEIALRHGKASGEVSQAEKIMFDFGQAFWPDIANGQESSRTSKLEINQKR